MICVDCEKEQKEIKKVGFRAARNKYFAVYRKTHKLKYKTPDHTNPKVMARQLLRNAVYRKSIVKPSACTSCGEEKRVEGHHKDYSKPLEVTWLCRGCHNREHAVV